MYSHGTVKFYFFHKLQFFENLNEKKQYVK